MEWPAQSLDLNKIENVRRKLKIELQKKQAHNITNVAVLEEAIRNIWMEIDLNFIRNFYNSFPKRIQTVI